MPQTIYDFTPSAVLKKLSNASTIGPLLMGLNRSVQIVPMDATVSDMVNVAVLAVHDAIRTEE